jgi:hypothetical protein
MDKPLADEDLRGIADGLGLQPGDAEDIRSALEDACRLGVDAFHAEALFYSKAVREEADPPEAFLRRARVRLVVSLALTEIELLGEWGVPLARLAEIGGGAEPSAAEMLAIASVCVDVTAERP